MKNNFLNKILNNLTDQRNILLSKLSKTGSETDIDIDGDEIDEIQGTLIASISSQLSFRDAQKLNQIENAIQKIEQGKFGICEDCDELISEKRLEVNPYFSTCIACAEQREFENKQKMRF